MGAECTGREMSYVITGMRNWYRVHDCLRRSWGYVRSGLGGLYTGVRAGAWEERGMERQHGFSAFGSFFRSSERW